ncbi:DNA-binding protein [Gorgonomyces haynaldii]|nr:DNA-binding protein [Gorgonomyces haynaldii]
MLQVQKSEITMQQSLNLVQNLLLATIGSISYVRVLFPDPYFHKKNVQGQSIQAIRRKASHESDQLLHWIEQGCFDALKKGYLKSLVFGIYETDPSDLIESYEFKFFYPEDGYSMSFGNTRFDLTRDKITLETTQMIRRLLLLTESLDPLPSVKYMTMRMTYYDHCPPDYGI